MIPNFDHRYSDARSILSRTSGFIAQAGFTHSLTPARNCTLACSYCYVPTMRIQGGLRPEDWQRWGQFTTFKQNAAALLDKELRAGQVIYCSPLVDPYQPSESLMPSILEALIRRPPAVFVIQTRSPLILRDVALLEALRERTTLRVSFSVTSNRPEVLRHYEPRCAPYEARLAAIRELNGRGIATHVTLAPLLPCDVERVVADVLEVSPYAVIGDPLHARATKQRGATTRAVAFQIAAHHGEGQWFDPQFQAALVEEIRQAAALAGRPFVTGPEGFSCLARPKS